MFHDILIRKNALLDDRNKKFKKSKNWNFSKQGLVHGFGLKLAIFLFSYFRQNRSGKCFTIFYKEKTPFQTKKNQKSRQSKNWDFSKGVRPWFWSTILYFSILIFFRPKKARKLCFTLCQKEKTHFQNIKTRSPKCQKSYFFPKGLFHDFGQKLAIFPSFHFCLEKEKNVFHEKTPF